MSTDYYFKKWNEVLKHLERITAIDVDLQVKSCIWHTKFLQKETHQIITIQTDVYRITNDT